MSDLSSFRKEEDEMLRYAHVERTVKKVYAFRYRGNLEDVPYFFLRKLAERSLRGRHPAVRFEVKGGLFAFCEEGNWIIVDQDGVTSIMTDSQYRYSYMPVRDLDY